MAPKKLLHSETDDVFPNESSLQKRPVSVTVSIGTSDGDHETLKQIFSTIPTRCGIIFVVFGQETSFLNELISQYTKMQVLTAEDGLTMRPNIVHVIPPDTDMVVHKDRFEIVPADRTMAPQGRIDRFFTSLALERGARTVAVVLAGVSVDVCEGIRKVKEAGGSVFVENSGETVNPARECTGVINDLTDFVFSAQEIATRLTALAEVECLLPNGAATFTEVDEQLQTLFTILKTNTGHDFSSYKRNTVLRRIERRMAVNGIKELSDYIAVLKETPQEGHALRQEMLIGMTNFFRDSGAFEFLEGEVIPRLFDQGKTEQPVRIWHACCATGEEAYSVAMLMLEYMEKANLQTKVQIFATDLDEKAIAKGRAGLYPDDIATDVSEERLKRFFTRSENCWRVKKKLREMIVFAHHNLIKDPPFSRIDLLVCRNFLIYVNPEIQQLLIPLFHQVLNPGGFLFLGSAETAGNYGDLFTPIAKKWKIFMRRGAKAKGESLFPFLGTARKISDFDYFASSSEVHEKTSLALAQKHLMERYIPTAYVVINEKNEVVHFSNRAGSYLLTPGGKPTRDLMKMAREELRPSLRAAVYKAFTTRKEAVYRGVNVTADGGEVMVNVIVVPLREKPSDGKLALVIFEPHVPSAVLDIQANETEGSGSDMSRNSLVRQLEEQLRVTGEQLLSANEQLETTNERFMSANEELMTVNEELQSTNEELQSTNEELVTVNSELQKKMEELNQSKSDLENLFSSSEIATMFLDRELVIKRFSPAMAVIFDLLPADIGRPFRYLNDPFDWSELPSDAVSVLEKSIPVEREVVSLKSGRSFVMRVLPYRANERLIDGIVVTLVDISERKRAEEALREGDERLRFALESCHIGAWEIDLVNKVAYRSEEHGRIFGYAPPLGKWTLEMFFEHVLPDDRSKVEKIVRQGLAERGGWSFECRIRRVDGRIRWIWVSGRPSINADGEMLRVTGVVQDITERKETDTALKQSEQLYRSLFDNMLNRFAYCKMLFEDNEPQDFIYLNVNDAFVALTGLKNVVGKKVTDVIPNIRETDAELFAIYGRVALTGIPERFEYHLNSLEMWFSVSVYSPQKEFFVAVFDVITERKRAEESLRLSEQRRSLALEASQAGTWVWNPHTDENIWSNELWQLYELEPYSCKPSYEQWLKTIHPGDREETVKRIQESVVQGTDFSVEWRLNVSDGREKWLMSRGKPFQEGTDRIVRYMGIVMDITDRKRAEEERKALHSQLVQAQKMEAIGTLAGGIAHDFNNILGAILGYTELARDAGPPDSPVAHDLQKVLEAGERAADLVRQILAFSRQTNTERMPLNPVQMIKEAIKLLRPALPSTITIEQQLATTTNSIFADPTQIHQIMMNLCTNAFHAMEKTGGILTIALEDCKLQRKELRYHPNRKTGKYVRLSISDTGAGIPLEIRDKIFNPYFTTKEMGRGTGLGLAIVHGIVSELGGFITCESEVEKGTVFRVFFPAIEAKPVVPAKKVDIDLSGAEHILLVDDEEVLVKMCKTMLERLGYTVTTSTDSLAALEIFRKQPGAFDAVITDQTMPKMTGFELAEKIMQIRPDTPIILCTGYSSLVNEEQAKTSGIKGFAFKPLTRKELAMVLRKVLDERPPA